MTKPPMRQKWMVSVVPIDAKTRVLELGFGHGVAASLICDRLDCGRYVGIDRSAKMTKAAEERNAHHVDSGLAEFRNASVDGVSLDERFDLVLAIHFPPLRQSGTAEVDFVSRHLEPTGQLWVGIQPLSGSPLPTSIEDIRARLEDNGFEIVDVVEGTPDGRLAAMISGRPSRPSRASVHGGGDPGDPAQENLRKKSRGERVDDVLIGNQRALLSVER